MSRMNEQSQQEEERENLSGNDDYEAYMHEQTELQSKQAESDSPSEQG